MRSETVIGNCKDTWKNLPAIITKLVLQNQFVFDYLKYEILRAEINYGIVKKKSQVLWDEKFQAPDIIKLGALAGIVGEMVNLGSTRRGIEAGGFDANEWTIQPDCVYLPGYLSSDEASTLNKMGKTFQKTNKFKDCKIVMPGVSLVYLQLEEAQI